MVEVATSCVAAYYTPSAASIRIVAELRGEGHQIEDETQSQVTPLMRKHVYPFGRYHFELSRMRQNLDRSPVAGA
jgi:hypothetical protein